MSRKNHKMIEGQLLQTDKRFSDLKMRQREKISGWLLEEYLKAVETDGIPLGKIQKEAIVDKVYEKIQECGIWIPYGEVNQYFASRLSKWSKKYTEKKQETGDGDERGQ